MQVRDFRPKASGALNARSMGTAGARHPPPAPLDLCVAVALRRQVRIESTAVAIDGWFGIEHWRFLGWWHVAITIATERPLHRIMVGGLLRIREGELIG